MTGRLKEKFLLFLVRNRRDPEAFGRIYDIYAARIYRFIYFKVSSKEEAQDLTSEVFLKTMEYLRGGKPVKHLSALLYRIARNLVTDFYRSHARQALFEEPLLERSEVKSELLKKIEIHSDVAAVYRAMQKLKEDYREVLTLKYIDELSVSEIAEVMEKQEGHVRVLIHRATNELRDIISFGNANETGQ